MNCGKCDCVHTVDISGLERCIRCGAVRWSETCWVYDPEIKPTFAQIRKKWQKNKTICENYYFGVDGAKCKGMSGYGCPVDYEELYIPELCPELKKRK